VNSNATSTIGCKGWLGIVASIATLLALVVAIFALGRDILDLTWRPGQTQETRISGQEEPAKPTVIPSPASTPSPQPIDTSVPPMAAAKPTTLGPSFGEIRFCLKDQLDSKARLCEISQDTFNGQIERVYISWTYSNAEKGMRVNRKWYWNGELIYARPHNWEGDWQTEGVSEYTWLDAKGVDALGNPRYFPSGSYAVEMYIGDRLEQRGNFVIQR